MTMQVAMKDETLRALLVQRNWTMAELARRAKINRKYLSSLLVGHRRPGPSVRQRLLDALGAEWEDVFELDALDGDEG